jgi:protoporphyrinogen oxidase
MASMPDGHFWRRTFGHIPGGGHRLVQALAARVAASGGDIQVGRSVTRLEVRGNRITSLTSGNRRNRDFDAVISTVPLPVLGRKLLPADRDVPWPPRIDYLPVAVLVLVLSRSVSPHFWLNTNDPEFGTAGFIEYTNLEPLPAHPDLHLVYVPFYAGSDGPDFVSPAAVLDRVLVDLRRVSPGIQRSHIHAWGLFRDAFGQSVCRVGESFPAGEGRTPWQNLFVTDSAYLHPEDRTVDGAMRLGRRAASQTLGSLGLAGSPEPGPGGSRP